MTVTRTGTKIGTSSTQTLPFHTDRVRVVVHAGGARVELPQDTRIKITTNWAMIASIELNGKVVPDEMLPVVTYSGGPSCRTVDVTLSSTVTIAEIRAVLGLAVDPAQWRAAQASALEQLRRLSC